MQYTEPMDSLLIRCNRKSLKIIIHPGQSFTGRIGGGGNANYEDAKLFSHFMVKKKKTSNGLVLRLSGVWGNKVKSVSLASSFYVFT